MDANTQNHAAIAALEKDIREMKFGTISGLVVREGCIEQDATRKRYTRKPRPAKRDEVAASTNLHESLQDFRRDVEDLRGNWTVAIKVANGLPQSWDREPIGSS